MKLRIHTCAAAGCQHVISTRMLMCLDHWRMVPLEQRRLVLNTLKEMRMHPSELKAIRAYQDAVDAAVDQVKKKQESRASAAAAASGSLFT